MQSVFILEGARLLLRRRSKAESTSKYSSLQKPLPPGLLLLQLRQVSHTPQVLPVLSLNSEPSSTGRDYQGVVFAIKPFKL